MQVAATLFLFVVVGIAVKSDDQVLLHLPLQACCL